MEKNKSKMVVHCHKRGHSRESYEEYMDHTACPNCGIHGHISTSNCRVVSGTRFAKLVPQ
jgi:predicted RNA-binding Zn-ribbon protein involved in translation (DUF1610 family)